MLLVRAKSYCAVPKLDSQILRLLSAITISCGQRTINGPRLVISCSSGLHMSSLSALRKLANKKLRECELLYKKKFIELTV